MIAQLRRAEREIAARDELLATVSHELRGPLSAVAINLDLLLRGLDDEPHAAGMRARVERIRRATERMQQLVSTILDAASIEDRQFKITADVHEVDALVIDAFDMLEPLAQDKSVGLRRVIDANAVVWCDRRRVLQVLNNVIANAIRFTPPGGVVVVRAGRTGREAMITVRDTGPGISEEHLPRIFDRRWRGARDDGSGLGLFIAKGLVEAHGGRIWAESAPGQGATLRFTLPLAVSDVLS